MTPGTCKRCQRRPGTYRVASDGEPDCGIEVCEECVRPAKHEMILAIYGTSHACGGVDDWKSMIAKVAEESPDSGRSDYRNE